MGGSGWDGSASWLGSGADVQNRGRGVEEQLQPDQTGGRAIDSLDLGGCRTDDVSGMRVDGRVSQSTLRLRVEAAFGSGRFVSDDSLLC